MQAADKEAALIRASVVVQNVRDTLERTWRSFSPAMIVSWSIGQLTWLLDPPIYGDNDPETEEEADIEP